MKKNSSFGYMLDIGRSILCLESRLEHILSTPYLSYDIEYSGIIFKSGMPLTLKEKSHQDKKRIKLVKKLVSDFLRARVKRVRMGYPEYGEDENPADLMISHIESSYKDPVEVKSPLSLEEYEAARKETMEKGKERALNEESYQVKIQNQMIYKEEDFKE